MIKSLGRQPKSFFPRHLDGRIRGSSHLMRGGSKAHFSLDGECDFCLLALADEKRKNSFENSYRLFPFNAPSIGRLPHSRLTPSNRTKAAAAAKFFAALHHQFRRVNDSKDRHVGKYRLVLRVLGNEDAALAVHYPSQPCRISGFHNLIILLNPKYAELAEKRIGAEAPMFNEVEVVP